MKKELETATAFLDSLNGLPEEELQHFPDLEAAVATFYKKVRKRRRRANGKRRKQADRQLVKEVAAERESELNQIELTPGTPRTLKHKSRTCYCCNKPYRTVHARYHWLCEPCGDLSTEKRKQVADLSGYQAIVTGGRIKIGFQTAYWLLRCGATVHVTTRFPVDAAIRFSELPEFDSFQDRLKIHELDFRNLPAIFQFIEQLKSDQEVIDILINNAAQSVRRSQQWHERLHAAEGTSNLLAHQQKLLALPKHLETPISIEAGAREGELQELAESISLRQVAQIRDDDDRLDTREKNTWNTDLLDTDPLEILEVLLVNSNAPALLVRGLVPLMSQSDGKARFIVNVVGADSMFSLDKSGYHPHVNMSKAALNMLTHSCANRLSQQGIFLNSVDTGWITHEGGRSNRDRLQDEGFLPPYDHLDGAARVMDSILQVVSGKSEPQHGKLFRNFKPFSW